MYFKMNNSFFDLKKKDYRKNYWKGLKTNINKLLGDSMILHLQKMCFGWIKIIFSHETPFLPEKWFSKKAPINQITEMAGNSSLEFEMNDYKNNCLNQIHKFFMNAES